jgi:transcriptional regulator with XRE-family HTH domain
LKATDEDNSDMESFGQRLRARAQELGISDSEVARRLSVGQSTYANYVADRREPDYRTLLRICHVLGTTPDALLLGSEPVDGEEEFLEAKAISALRSMTLAGRRRAVAVVETMATTDLAE